MWKQIMMAVALALSTMSVADAATLRTPFASRGSDQFLFFFVTNPTDREMQIVSMRCWSSSGTEIPMDTLCLDEPLGPRQTCGRQVVASGAHCEAVTRGRALGSIRLSAAPGQVVSILPATK